MSQDLDPNRFIHENISLDKIAEYVKDVLRGRPEFKKMKEDFIAGVKAGKINFREFDLAFSFVNNRFGKACGHNEVILWSTWYGDPELRQ